MAANYNKLKEHLESVNLESNTIRLTFEQIEALIGDKLPEAAHEYRTWWSNQINGNEPQKESWVKAGFMVIKVKFSENYVDFLKIGS